MTASRNDQSLAFEAEGRKAALVGASALAVLCALLWLDAAALALVCPLVACAAVKLVADRCGLDLTQLRWLKICAIMAIVALAVGVLLLLLTNRDGLPTARDYAILMPLTIAFCGSGPVVLSRILTGAPRRKLLQPLAAYFSIGVLGLAIGTAIVSPRSSLGIAAFRIGYALVSDTQAYLAAYSPLARDVGGGYLPAEVDNFLCQRLEESGDGTEIWAIVNMYAIQRYRGSNCLQSVSNPARDRAFAASAFNFSSSRHYEGMAIVIEQLRTRKEVCKAGVSSKRGYSHYREAVLQIAPHLAAWLKLDMPWRDRVLIDPFAASDVHVVDGCY